MYFLRQSSNDDARRWRDMRSYHFHSISWQLVVCEWCTDKEYTLIFSQHVGVALTISIWNIKREHEWPKFHGHVAHMIWFLYVNAYGIETSVVYIYNTWILRKFTLGYSVYLVMYMRILKRITGYIGFEWRLVLNLLFSYF